MITQVREQKSKEREVKDRSKKQKLKDFEEVLGN